MFKKWTAISLALALCVALPLAGCQTRGGSAAAGGLSGAGLGAIIGHQSGHAGEGAVIGGLAGTLAGVVVHEVKARKTQSREETVQAYSHKSADPPMVTIEEDSVTPKEVRVGEQITSQVKYVLLGTDGNVNVTETRTLKKDGGVVAELSSESVTRDDGTWVSAQEFTVTEDLEPGAYQLEHAIQTPFAKTMHTTGFTVVQ